MRDWLLPLASVGLLVVFTVILLRGVLADRSRAARGAVAAAPEPIPPRLADLIERISVVEADNKAIRREWAGFEESWERRWGTIARAQRREAAREAAEPEPTPDAHDPAQERIEFAPPPAAAAAGERRRLRPALMHLGRGS